MNTLESWRVLVLFGLVLAIEPQSTQDRIASLVFTGMCLVWVLASWLADRYQTVMRDEERNR